MDIHNQLNKNMEEIVQFFQSRMEQYDKALEETAAKATKTSSSSTTEFSRLAADFNSFKKTVWDSLSLIKQQAQLLATAIDSQEMRSRHKVLLIHGVEEDEREIPEEKVCAFIKEQLKCPPTHPDNFDICHRLGIRKDKPRPMFVRFTTLKLKHTIWSSKTNLKGSGFSLSEFFTKPRQEVFVAARKHFGVRNCWSADGIIHLILPDKTRRKIVTLQEFHEIADKFPTCAGADTRPTRTRKARNVKK